MSALRFFVLLSLASLSALVLTAWAQNRSYHQDMRWQAPPKAVMRANPLAGNASGSAVAGGKKLFRRHCVECHGADGTGIRHAANLQSADVQVQTDGILFWKVTNGNLDRGMPAFSGLPELERWQLVLYLRKLGGDGLR